MSNCFNIWVVTGHSNPLVLPAFILKVVESFNNQLCCSGLLDIRLNIINTFNWGSQRKVKQENIGENIVVVVAGGQRTILQFWGFFLVFSSWQLATYHECTNCLENIFLIKEGPMKNNPSLDSQSVFWIRDSLSASIIE